MARAPKQEVRDIAVHTSNRASEILDQGTALFPNLADKHIIAAHFVGMAIAKMAAAHAASHKISIEQATEETLAIISASSLGGERGRGESLVPDIAEQSKEKPDGL